MRLTPAVQHSVLFIGYETDKSHGYIKPVGTAFLFQHEGYGYLVTAQHVAVDIGDSPFMLRFNRRAGGSHAFRVDPIYDKIKWERHSDPNVDLAVLPFQRDLNEHGLINHFLHSEMVVREDSLPSDFG